MNGKVSVGLEAVILKCLEKDPGRRYASTRDIAVALRQLETGVVPRAQQERQRRMGLRFFAVALAIVLAIGAGYFIYRSVRPSTRTIHSIAVLPLSNLSGDPNQEYFADGITESLITDLGRLTGLERVIARGSVMPYKDTKKTPAEIARELNVDALITGSVLRSGKRVRVTAQLIQPESGQQLWAEHYERDLTDVLRLQSEVTNAIAGGIRLKLSVNDQSRLASARPVNPEAYDAYLMGRFYTYKFTPKDFDKALEYFQVALDKDPQYAQAHAGVGFVWSLRAVTGLVPSKEGWERARISAIKAIELDPNGAEGHETLAGTLAFYDWKWEAGEKEFRRAIELNPNYASVRCFYSFYLFMMRRGQEATAQMQKAIELDPYNAFYSTGLATEFLTMDRSEEALVLVQKAKALQPDSGYATGILRHAFERTGRLTEAWAALQESAKLSGFPDEVTQAMERGYRQGGYWAARRAIADSLAKRAERAPVNSFTVAQIYVTLGEDELALQWLERACNERSSMMGYMNVQHVFDRLRSQPRFQAISRRMNLPQ